MAASDEASFEIETRWKEEVYYWEGAAGFCFHAGWGVTPPVLLVPSLEHWDSAVPGWLRGRRDEVIRRLEAHSEHVLKVDDRGYESGQGSRHEATR